MYNHMVVLKEALNKVLSNFQRVKMRMLQSAMAHVSYSLGTCFSTALPSVDNFHPGICRLYFLQQLARSEFGHSNNSNRQICATENISKAH